MLSTLKDLFSALLPAPSTAGAQAAEHTLQLACAVMLVEVMRADDEMSPDERLSVMRALRSQFSLADDEIERLIELAEQTARQATDWFAFTDHINRHFDTSAKLHMVELMWQVAYADGHLDAHERHVLWRIADLLHVPQGAYVHARLRAQAAAGL